MSMRPIRAALAGTAIVAGAALAFPVAASAAPSQSFTQAQQTLEQQLANRVSQLSRLSADVAGAKSLTTAHANVLNARLATETSDINGLVAKVPGDTTFAELSSDRAAMLRDNRVYAVATPQVFETIAADAIAAEVTTDQSDESTLQSSLSSLVGQPGYRNATAHYDAFVAAVNRASTVATNVATRVMAQVPADFPGDTHVFTTANRALLEANLALAHAAYDETVIGLATGGYTGP